MNSFVEGVRSQGRLVVLVGLLLNLWSLKFGGVGAMSGIALTWVGSLAAMTKGIEDKPGTEGLAGFGWGISLIASTILGWASIDLAVKGKADNGTIADVWVTTLIVWLFTIFLTVLLRRFRLQEKKPELPEL